ncbi:MAG: hypothetical protein H6700_10965 [Myxococcales bacterium]|nr:hypothetical protein [Myxococcales bacterium]MCB9532276.1 hypothetical protein [Myxococcales bacterium]
MISLAIAGCGAAPTPGDAPAVASANEAAANGSTANESPTADEPRTAAATTALEPDVPRPPQPPAPPPNAAELVLAAAGSLELTRDAGDGVVSSDDAAPARLALTLSGCRFVEVEPTLEVGADADCLEVARRGVLGREAAVVRAPAGHVEFAVTNAGEREAGIWIRSSDRPGGAILSAGGVAAGSTGSWDVELAPGTYLYSCPLTPTAIYTLEVW